MVEHRAGYSEIALYHDPSEMLVVADLLFNVRVGGRALEWLFRLNGAWRRATHTRLQRALYLRNHDALSEFYAWALTKPFSRLSMSHGHVVSDDAREVFYRAFHRWAA